MTPFFNTHHAPVGAWTSLTFGSPDTGVSIDFQEPERKESGALLFGVAGSREVRTIGFARNKKAFAEYCLYDFAEIQRMLTPSIDSYQAGNLTVRIYTPYDALPDPEQTVIPGNSCLPGILMDVLVDNSKGKEPCTAFIGLAYKEPKKLSLLEDGSKCGFCYGDQWGLAVQEHENVILVQGAGALQALREGRTQVHPNGPAFIGLRVGAGQSGKLTVGWAVHAVTGSIGEMESTYYYNRYFGNLKESLQGVLENAEDIRRASERLDREWACAGQGNGRRELFCQAIRSYYASSQLLEDEGGAVHWNICEGAYLWRNTMDLCADHIAWELKRNPWIVRSLMEDFLRDYAYCDRVVFPGMEGEHDGGISFTHDMGCFMSYSPHGRSAYERTNGSGDGFYFYMTTEELLNGIYCICGYALWTKDKGWLARQEGLLSAFMTSLENRDAPADSERNGILKAVSLRSGSCGLESTTYDALDHSLLEASGSLYIFIKTWCALVLLKKSAGMLEDTGVMSRAARMLERCKKSISCFRTEEASWLRANACKDIPGAVAAAVEPMALPHMLGVLEESELYEALRRHSKGCLQEGVCIDSVTGGLRLSSNSNNTWPSKVILTMYSMETVLGLELPVCIERELMAWAQVSAREATLSDQVQTDTRAVIGGFYYPRAVTAALWADHISDGRAN